MNLIELSNNATKKLLQEKATPLSGGWYIYFGEKGVLISKEKTMAFSYLEAFSEIPNIIDFFKAKVKSYFGAEPSDLKPNRGESVFEAVERINKVLGSEDNDGKMMGKILIKVSKFNEIMFNNIDINKSCFMTWTTFFVKLPKALLKMKEQYKKIGKGGGE